MKLNIEINNIKSVKYLNISLPIQKGLYAITGSNGAGKSTIVTCASRAFFKMRMEDYFGVTIDGANIKSELNGIVREWKYNADSGEWNHTSNGRMEISGFYEGSLIYGNRFRNLTFDRIRSIESIKQDKLIPASDFIRTNLGLILQGDKEFYEKIWMVSRNFKGFEYGYVFFYEKNGRRISQFHMSTGENLLISILNSIYMRNSDRRSTGNPCVIFLDEIELALHPSSLKRLVIFLRSMTEMYNYAIYFSTHSIELISGIAPDNIFYIERHSDDSVEVLNPCYPAYATKFLYDHQGYDNIILVEDDLAKEIITRIIKKESLMDNKLIHVLPCGGHNQVLDLADDVTRNNLLGKKASICVILDGDIEQKAEEYKRSKNICNNIPVKYLPIESLEKYLRTTLYESVDHVLFRKLENYLFQQVSLKEIIDQYKTNPNCNCDTDNNGKRLYNLIDTELRNRNKNRNELVQMIVEYLFDNSDNKTLQTKEFLNDWLS